MARREKDPETSAPLSRRELLELGATTAAGLGVLRLIRPEPARAQDSEPPTAPDGPILPSYGFGVEVDGSPAAGPGVVAVEIDPVVFVKRYKLGYIPEPAFARLVTSGDPAASAELEDWFRDCVSGKNIRKNISVTLFKSDKSAGRSYTLNDCFPTQWSSVNFDTSSTVQTETLTVKIGRIEFKT